MEYAGFLIRRKRLARNWSQEGLCRGICTVSHLSKIEQGKTRASREVLELLLERMDCRWMAVEDRHRAAVERAWDAWLGWENGLLREILDAMEPGLEYSELGPDVLLLEQWLGDREPLDRGLETALDDRQLALQRMLQGRFEEAARLNPCAAVVGELGELYYRLGQNTQALDTLQRAYDLAAREGRPVVMLYTKLTMGSCHSNLRRYEAMEEHYTVAERLARVLGDEDSLDGIRYNRAATLLELGEYAKAMTYFESLAEPSVMELHKLAVCCEGLDRRADALAVLDRAAQAPSPEHVPEDLEQAMLELVRFRLLHSDYLDRAEYGTLLLELFAQLRERMPLGYAMFHLDWVLEWYEHNRLYKQAYELTREFSQMSG